MDLFKSLTASGEFGDDGVDGSGPNKGPRVLIPCAQELLNRSDEIGHAEKGIAANLFIGQLGEPPLDEVQPTATGRHKMRDKTRVSFKPGLDLDGVMGSVVVHHQMERRLAGEFTVEAAQKLQELLMAMTLVKVADDFTFEQIESGKQGSRSMPFVVMRHRAAVVQNAVELSWSNGPAEGHINRLKTLKRQMYGRARFELLRARLLPFSTIKLHQT